MPTPRSPDTDKRSEERKKAERMYLDNKGNIKLVEIAEKLGLPDNKVRKWKSLDNWEGKLHPDEAEKGKKKPVERSTKDKGSVPHKGGAPKGNQNAKGNRGNPKPKNTTPPNQTKHGGYSNVYWDVLDDDEKELIEQIPEDEEELLIEQIQLFTLRERRILKAINKYRNNDSPVALTFSQRSERKRSFDSDEDKVEYEKRIREKVENGERLPGNEYGVFTQTDNKDNIIVRLEQELSNVQNKKTKAIETLYKIRLEKQKLESAEAGNTAVDDWISAVLGEDVSENE